ncbi:MAG: hypothetical protein ABIL04_02000 [candidate division WOR-3 bacterium]
MENREVAMLKSLSIFFLFFLAFGAKDISLPSEQPINLQTPETDQISIPLLLNYQGKITDNIGNPVRDSSYSVTFRLFNVPSGGTAFWNETQTIQTRAGLFHTLLGSVTPIPSLPLDGNLYLEMQVNPNPAMTPRVRIVSSAYSYIARKSDSTNYLNQMGASTGQVLKWNGTTWAPGNDEVGGDNAWVRGTPDSVLYTIRRLGIARGGSNNMLYGSYRYTHTNLGVSCTTGTSGQNYYYCTVGGGISNKASGNWATVSGGGYNTASMAQSTVGGGYFNTASGDYAVIGGGVSNRASGYSSSITGGYNNTATADYATVAGGYCDSAKGKYAGALSGYHNVAGSALGDSGAVVAGGYNNNARSIYTFIGGGRNNATLNSGATVSGGIGNVASGNLATIGGGQENFASNYYTTVSGGFGDTATGYLATIAGGRGNIASGNYSTVSGGVWNRAFGNYATVSGGDRNIANGNYVTIGGGGGNRASVNYSTVGGGYENFADSSYATIGGGNQNLAPRVYATIGGGSENFANGPYATIGGGWKNWATGDLATIGGGYGNMASIDYATVAGGYCDTSAGPSSFTTNSHSVVYFIYGNSAAFNGQAATASNQLRCGTLSKAGGSFTIDHPLDPYNKILNHYFIEGPEMLNIYRGSVVLDASGRAEVRLPDYFSALNRNPHIQLTGVGSSDVYVAEDIKGNVFVIGGKPRTKVYWLVTGERQDISAEAIRRLMPVEQPKIGELKGRMLDDDFLVGCMEQLEREGKASGIDFRTAAGRNRYQDTKRRMKGE